MPQSDDRRFQVQCATPAPETLPPQMSEAQSSELGRRARRAVALLERIADGGYFKGFFAFKQRGELNNDKDLNPLRGRPDFRGLLDRVNGKSTPDETKPTRPLPAAVPGSPPSR